MRSKSSLISCSIIRYMSLLYHLDHPLQRFDALLEKTVGGSLGKKAVGKSSPKFFQVTAPELYYDRS